MRHCVFCGQAAGSREHVIARWLNTPIQSTHPVGEGMQRVGLTHRVTAPGETEPFREWTPAGPDLVTRRICAACNTGWLAELEVQARPVLTRLVAGVQSDLRMADQQAVATWAYKTVLLMDLVRATGPPLVPPKRYAQLFDTRRPPTDVRIWLGLVDRGPNVLHHASTAIEFSTLQSTLPGYLTVLTLGRLIVVCAGRSDQSEDPLRHEARGAGHTLMNLWPASVAQRTFPPSAMLSELGFAILLEEL